MLIRINRFLSLCGLGSRRQVEFFLQKKTVTLNGRPITDLSTRIDPGKDRVALAGKALVPQTQIKTLLLNKPAGYVTTRQDEWGRATVYSLLPPDLRQQVKAVGRLDRESRGLLLFTNHGILGHRLMHPRYHAAKTYRVYCRGTLSAADVARLRAGVELEDGRTLPAEVEKIPSDRKGQTALLITLREGRKRQIRRMFMQLKRPVTDLQRISQGPLSLGSLAEGAWRYLTAEEGRRLWESVELPPSGSALE